MDMRFENKLDLSQSDVGEGKEFMMPQWSEIVSFLFC